MMQALHALERSLNAFHSLGSGTTALYLARHLSEDVSIACVPCVGHSAYLRAQMERLGAHRGHDRMVMPTILDPPPGKPSRFIMSAVY
jgi:hypothetical protein